MSGPSFETVARFFQEDGADRLVAAYTSLPPGPVRETLLSHVETMSAALVAQMGGSPYALQVTGVADAAVAPAPPKLGAPAASTPVAALEGPKFVSATSDGRVVERALQGMRPADIAKVEGVPLSHVERTLQKARREGGLTFPWDAEAVAKPAGLNPDKAPNGKRVLGALRRSAADQGVELDDYVTTLMTYLRRRQAGEPAAQLAQEMGVSVGTADGWWSRRQVYLDMWEPAARAPHPGENARELATATRAAKRWGFKSADEYLANRDKARQLRMEGKWPEDIALAISADPAFVRAAIHSGEQQGMKFPLLINVQRDGAQQQQ